MTAPVSDNYELEKARKQYEYNYTYLPPVAMLNSMPDAEYPAKEWWSILIRTGIQIIGNKILARYGDRGLVGYKDDVGKFFSEVSWKFLQEETELRRRLLWFLIKNFPKVLIKGFRLAAEDLEELAKEAQVSLGPEFLNKFFDRITTRIEEEKYKGTGSNLAEYNKQFSAIPLPPIAKFFAEDADGVFAYQRVAGPNPVMIERVNHCQGDRLSDRFPVTNAQYHAVMGNDDWLQAAIDEHRLYLADYSILDGAINGTYPEFQKYISAPKALFVVPRHQQRLVPVAIQCASDPNLPILLPPRENTSEHDRFAWQMARNVVQVADSNFHEAVTHLGRTHLFLSPFAMATHRQFVKSHPLYELLAPHFEGTFFINNGAQQMLMASGGGVDTTLAATIDFARAYAITGTVTYGFNSAMLPDQLRRRGVDNPKALPLYPYRDDALLLWEAIFEWVTDYIKVFYADDQAVRSDSALQAWAHELQAFEGGRVRDFGENGAIETRDYLIRATTLIIYTASAQHAAVNFPQRDQMVYTPAMPLANYHLFDGRGTANEALYFQQLPPLSQAEQQLELTHLLGSVLYTRLGQYKSGWFTNSQVVTKLTAFQKRLAEIETIIDGRNKERPYAPYEYLKPSQIPQSINI